MPTKPDDDSVISHIAAIEREFTYNLATITHAIAKQNSHLLEHAVSQAGGILRLLTDMNKRFKIATDNHPLLNQHKD